MTVAFSLGCFACCTPCDPCTAECDTTPDDNFEVVYQANDTDGALQWSGDAMGPIDGPYPGFEGSGPFSQTISLAEDFSVTMPGARFPCYARVKFWRNVGGGEGSDAVTQEVTITCQDGKATVGPLVLSEGESVYFGPYPDSSGATYRFDTTQAIPLVAGGDDQSLSPPLTHYTIGAECSGTFVSVSASLTWTNELIQHNLYGAFVECYDELPPGDPGDCLDCDGTPTPAPETVYLTISNFDGGGAVDGNGDPINYDGTYAVANAPTELECARYLSYFESYDILDTACNPPISIIISLNLRVMLSGGFLYIGPFVGIRQSNGSKMIAFFAVSVGVQETQSMLCQSVELLSGAASGPWKYQCGSVVNDMDMSFDWELST